MELRVVARGSRFFALWMMSFGAATALHAQSPAPLPLPNLNLVVNGNVEAIVRQPDGGTVLGGVFVSVAGVPRSNLARLLPSGALDPDWNPSADGEVKAIAVDASGNIYVGGYFQNLGGQPRSNLAKLDDSGLADSSWNPSPSSFVSALAIDGSNSLYVGGAFSQIGGSARSHIAKVSVNGAGPADPSWNPSSNNTVSVLAFDGTSVYAGGAFSVIGGLPRNGLAKLAASGSGAADTTWIPSIMDGSSIPTIRALVTDGTGLIYVGGAFLTPHKNLVKVATTGAGSVDAIWNPSPDSTVYCLSIGDNASLYAGGRFTQIGGQPRNNLARLSLTGAGAADPNWNPSPNDVVTTLANSRNGGVYAGGTFFTISGQQRLTLAAISAAGNVEPAVDVEGTPSVLAMAFQHGGGTILGGNFLLADGVPRRHLLRLLADRTLDPDWSPSVDGYVRSLAVDSSDNVFAVGTFLSVNNTSRYGAAKLDGSGTGSVDPDWNPAGSFVWNAPVSASTIIVGSDDSVYTASDYIISKISNTGIGIIDPDWNPALTGAVSAMAGEGDSIYLGGSFSSIGGQGIAHLAKVSAAGTGAVDATWHPSPNGGVGTIVLDGKGSLYAGGYFSNMGGVPRNHVARLSATGNGDVDPLWNPSLSRDGPFPWAVRAIAMNDSGSIFIVGEFDSIGGQSRNGLAKVSSMGTGENDSSWNPSPVGVPIVLGFADAETLFVGGLFTTIGAQPREAIAAFEVSDLIFANGFD